MAGFAIATMVPSSATIMTPMATEKSVSQGWPRSPLDGAVFRRIRVSRRLVDGGLTSHTAQASVSH